MWISLEYISNIVVVVVVVVIIIIIIIIIQIKFNFKKNKTIFIIVMIAHKDDKISWCSSFIKDIFLSIVWEKMHVRKQQNQWIIKVEWIIKISEFSLYKLV